MGQTADGHIKCEECPEQIKSDKWNVIRSDWFIQRNMKTYCPKHIPSWVEEWRKRTSPEYRRDFNR